MKKNIEYAFYILLTYTESWSDTISNTSITAAQVTIINDTTEKVIGIRRGRTQPPP